MNILYIAILSNSVPGVIKKITQSVLFLSGDNVQAKGLIISTGLMNPIEKYENIHILHISKPFFQNHRELIYNEISEYIEANYLETPLIYFRYPLGSKFLIQFTKRYGKNIIFEHNGIEEKELRMYQKYYNLKDFLYNLKTLNFKDYLGHLETIINEKKYGVSACSSVRGCIAMTSEIGLYQNKRSKNNKYTLAVIGNGINLSAKPLAKSRFLPVGEKITCVFVAGHANNWHGIDRVLKGILAYEGKVKIELIYIGIMNSMAHNLCKNPKLSQSIKHIPNLNTEDIGEIIRRSDIGFSSLGVHRVDVRQACVLKTREYLAYGLPVVFSYEDEEIENEITLNKCIFKAPSDETSIDFGNLIRFLNCLSQEEITPKIIAEKAWNNFNIKQRCNLIRNVFLQKI